MPIDPAGPAPIQAAEMAATSLSRPLAARYGLVWLRDARDPGRWHRDAVAVALASDADSLAREALEGDGWAADARNAWAGTLRREASRMVAEVAEAEGLVLDLPQIEADARGVASWLPGGLLPVTPADTPDGPALALDLAGIRWLEGLAARLKVPTAPGAEGLRADARERWANYQRDPNGPAADPLSEALAEHHADALSGLNLLTNSGALWAWWTREEEPHDPQPWGGGFLRAGQRGYELPQGGYMLPATVHPPPFLRRLAWVLWRGLWKGEAEKRQKAHNQAPGLVAPVYGRVGDSLVMARPDKDLGRLIGTKDGRQLPLLPATSLDKLTGAPALGKLTSQRLVRWLIWSAAQGHYRGTAGLVELEPGVDAEHHATGVNLIVTGGLQRLAEAIGANSNKASGEIRDVLNVLNGTRLDWDAPGDRGAETLIGWRETKAAPDAPAILKIRVGPLLCPGLAPSLPKGSPDRLIVPVLPFPSMEGLATRQMNAAARLDWLAVRELAERCQAAASNGGAFIPWDRLAKEAGASSAALKCAMAAWTSGPAPRWVEPSPGLWMLGDADPAVRAARDFILDGGERRIAASKAGTKSGRNRRRKIKG